MWRAFGLSDPDPAARPCSSRDVTAISALGALRDQISEDAALQMARAMGSSMSRLADTGVSMVRALAEAPLRTAGAGNVEIAHELVRAAEGFLPASLPVMDAVLRHHVVAAGRRYSLWGVRPTERSTTDAVVGFADLVGFTTLGQHLDPAEVDTLIRRFEELALDATTRRPLSRLVKLIGDEALFVAGDMTSALEIADDLARDPDLPPLRVGLAAGVIIVREGDVFGPVVNLASRLVELAEPGQVCSTGEPHSASGASGASRSASGPSTASTSRSRCSPFRSLARSVNPAGASRSPRHAVRARPRTRRVDGRAGRRASPGRALRRARSSRMKARRQR